eukprot:m.442602 g.442602  ORF g.442602 m.442602 type:complete len:55 (-) comp18826_c0_seq1:615-779(-)
MAVRGPIQQLVRVLKCRAPTLDFQGDAVNSRKLLGRKPKVVEDHSELIFSNHRL